MNIEQKKNLIFFIKIATIISLCLLSVSISLKLLLNFIFLLADNLSAQSMTGKYLVLRGWLSSLIIVICYEFLIGTVSWIASQNFYNNRTVEKWVTRAAEVILVSVILSVAFIVVIFGILIALNVYKILWPNILAAGATVPALILITIICLVGAFAVYRFRYKYRVLYGATEIVFGILSVCYSTFSLFISQNMQVEIGQSSGSKYFQITISFLAGVYVIVRGLNNVEDGLKLGVLGPSILKKILRRKIAEQRLTIYSYLVRIYHRLQQL